MSTVTDGHWVGWVWEHRIPEWCALDPVMEAPEKYGARLHYAPLGIGAEGGAEGEALCGEKVPEDRSVYHEPKLWVDPHFFPTAPKCKRCLGKIAKGTG